jgi:cytochrome b561
MTISAATSAIIAEIVIVLCFAALAVRHFIAVSRSRARASTLRPGGYAEDNRSATGVRKYHPVLAVLHWFAAFAMAQLIIRGAFIMVNIPNSDPAKIDRLRIHMFFGTLVLIVMLTRLLLRNATLLPEPASPRSRFLNGLKKIILPLLYICVIFQALAGLGLAFESGLISIVLAGHGTLPPDFWLYPLRTVHYLNSRLLVALITLHISGALYHTFILRDGLLRRMSFGKRRAASFTAQPAE